MQPTKLEDFIRQHHIKPAALAREAGCARQHLVRIRSGQTPQPRRGLKQAIAAACAKLSRHEVAADDLF